MKKDNSNFMMSRVGLLIRNALGLNLPAILFSLASLACLLLLASLFDAYTGCSKQFYRSAFLTMFFPVGIMITSRIFKGLHDPLKGYFWILLPSSCFEKTLSCILLTTLIYSGGSLVIFFLLSLGFEGINWILFRQSHPLFHPLDPMILKSIWIYIAVQAPFLAGAVWFKRHALSKTVLVLACISLLFMVGIILAVRFIFGGGLSVQELSALFSDDTWETFSSVGSGLILIGKALFWLVLPLVSWVICYLRLKEAEF